MASTTHQLVMTEALHRSPLQVTTTGSIRSKINIGVFS
jgi:hypothetical protein